MAIGDVFQLNVIGQLHGQTTVNTFYFRVRIDGGGDPRDALISAWVAGVRAGWLSAANQEWVLARLEASGIQPASPKLERADGVGTGLSLGPCLPSEVTAVIRRKTLEVGRRGRGRVYIPAVSSSFENDSRLSAAGTLAYLALIDVLKVDIMAIGYTFSPQHVSRTPLSAYPIDRWVVDDVLRSQRRRQPGRGI